MNSDHTEKAAIVVQSFHGDVYIFYSLDVITNDLEDTQYRLNKYINVDNPRPTGGSGGGGGTPIADHTEERCSICGGSGKRTCSSCYGSGDIDCGGCYGNEPCSQCGGDGRRDCPNINCSNGMVDCTTCGGDGKK